MIQNLFSIPIYKVKYPDSLEKEESLIRELFLKHSRDIETGNLSLMRNGGMSCAKVLENLHLDPNFKNVASFYQEHAEIFWRELNYNHKRLPRLYTMWANVYPPGAWIDAHDHSPMPLTGSFYIKKSIDSSNLVFEHPLEIILKHQPFAEVRNREQYFKLFEHEVLIEQGDLVLFPSYLRHKTRPCTSSEDRIIIGGTLDQNYRTRINDR